jgi:hypothetical protein
MLCGELDMTGEKRLLVLVHSLQSICHVLFAVPEPARVDLRLDWR